MFNKITLLLGQQNQHIYSGELSSIFINNLINDTSPNVKPNVNIDSIYKNFDSLITQLDPYKDAIPVKGFYLTIQRYFLLCQISTFINDIYIYQQKTWLSCAMIPLILISHINTYM